MYMSFLGRMPDVSLCAREKIGAIFVTSAFLFFRRRHRRLCVSARPDNEGKVGGGSDRWGHLHSREGFLPLSGSQAQPWGISRSINSEGGYNCKPGQKGYFLITMLRCMGTQISMAVNTLESSLCTSMLPAHHCQ